MPSVLIGKNMKLKIISLLIVIVIGCAQAKIQPENYCDDKTAWNEWDELLKVHPNNKEMQMLHALRIGLCMKIEQGSITIQEAINLFNHAHQIVVERAKKRKFISDPSKRL